MAADEKRRGDRDSEFGEAVVAGSGERPEPGDIVIDPDTNIAPEPLVGDDASTPLEEEEPEGNIPPCPLWAMKARRHTQWHLLASSERHARLRLVLGGGNETLYVIDDGRHHATIGRRVASLPGVCEYCLIGRVSREQLAALQDGLSPLRSAFDQAAELTLCGVAEEEDVASSNIFDVARYNSADEIPIDYRPGSPALRLSDDLEITVD